MNKSTYTMGVKAYVRPEMQIVEAGIASLVCTSLTGAEAENVETEARGNRLGYKNEEINNEIFTDEADNYGDLWQ